MGAVQTVVALNGNKLGLGNHTECISEPGISGPCQRRCGSEGRPRTRIRLSTVGGEESGVLRPPFALSHYSKQQICLTSTSKYGSPPLSTGDTFQDPQWVHEAIDTTEPYINCFSVHTHTFSLKGSTSGLLSGMSELPAVLFLYFGAIIK